MNYKSHIIISLILGMLFISLTHYFFNSFNLLFWKTYIICFFIICIYGLLPDIDTESSKIVWFFIGTGIVGAIVSVYFKNYMFLYLSLALLSLVFIAVKFTTHRGIIHTIEAGLISAAPMYFIFNWEYSLLAFVCFYSHLLGDGYFFKLN